MNNLTVIFHLRILNFNIIQSNVFIFYLASTQGQGHHNSMRNYSEACVSHVMCETWHVCITVHNYFLVLYRFLLHYP